MNDGKRVLIRTVAFIRPTVTDIAIAANTASQKGQ